jgi:hypothetical protein
LASASIVNVPLLATELLERGRGEDALSAGRVESTSTRPASKL